MRLSPSFAPVARPVRFGQQTAPQDPLDAQATSFPGPQVTFEDGTVLTVHIALNEPAKRITAYVHTTDPNKATAIQKAQDCVHFPEEYTVHFKPYDESLAKA